MPTNRKRLIRWGAALSLLAALGYAGYTLSQLAPVGTAYAAKILCTGVFVSGRPADAVIDEDIMAGVHPLLKLVHASVDTERRRARASFVGFAVREAGFRPGLGCTLALGVSSDALAATSSVDSDPPGPSAAPTLMAGPPPPGVDARKLQEAVDSAFAEPNPAQPRRTRALVVVYRGRVIAERFAPGFSADMPLIGWSMAKSVTAALVGVLVKEGKLAVDASALLPEWRGDRDPRARITLDQLLRMTSGLRFNEDYADPLSDVAIMLFAQPDAAEFAALKPLDFKPGTRWQYSSGTTAILARVLRQAVGGTAEDYLQFPRRALFNPLGMRTAVFEPDAAGMLGTPSFMYASAHDWARFGQLLLQDGMWEGKRLLPAGWVRYMTRVTPQSPRRDFGADLWVKVPEPFNSRAPPPPALPADAFHAVGHEGQFVSVIPSRQLVVVRLGLTRPESAWDHETFLARLLEAFPSDNP
jgi:CubicO group peptidase (beta-lactamase class C family)